MKHPQSHYSNYLLTAHFDRRFTQDRLPEMIEFCESFLNELGNLARQSAIRLHATYSIVVGKYDHHAHFALNWLPCTAIKITSYKGQFNPIQRKKIIRMLEAHNFYVDNQNEAVKRITSRKDYVTDYVVFQPKEGQTTVHTSFFIYGVLEVGHSAEKSYRYYSGLVSLLSERVKNISPQYQLFIFILISITILNMIKLIIHNIS